MLHTPRIWSIGFFGVIAAAAAFACGQAPATGANHDKPVRGGGPRFDGAGDGHPQISPAALLDRLRLLFQPLPENADLTGDPPPEARIALGKSLFFDPRLSKNHDVSCSTCHDLQNYGIEPKTSARPRGERNVPTVYNAALQLAQFWDGRAQTVEAQAGIAILNPVEIGATDRRTVVKTLASIPGYVAQFKAAFPTSPRPVTFDNIGQAIGAYERRLLTAAPYDRFLRGDMTALDGHQLYGLQLFLDVGCTQCHLGAPLGGTQFQKLGSVLPWPGVQDQGRAAITQSKLDQFVFKVSGMRNITETGPYMHNGSIDSLPLIVNLMAKHQTARGELKPQEIAAIVAFLGSLKGKIPKDLATPPALPDNGPRTPTPDPS